MTTFDLSILSGSVCGLLMVVGGLVLLYRGAVTLNEASKEAALSVEFQKTLKITTR